MEPSALPPAPLGFALQVYAQRDLGGIRSTGRLAAALDPSIASRRAYGHCAAAAARGGDGQKGKAVVNVVFVFNESESLHRTCMGMILTAAGPTGFGLLGYFLASIPSPAVMVIDSRRTAEHR
jgi:hypothetical protein